MTKYLSIDDIRERLRNATWNTETPLLDLFGELERYCSTNEVGKFEQFFGSLPTYISTGGLVVRVLNLRRDVLGAEYIYQEIPDETS